MAENIKEVVEKNRSELKSRITRNTELTETEADKSVDVLKQSLVNTFLKELTTGNFSQIKNIFQKDEPVREDHPVKNDAKSEFIDNLVKKMNLPPTVASKISDVAIPFIMDKISTHVHADNLQESELNHMLGMDKGKTASDKLSKTVANLKKTFS